MEAVQFVGTGQVQPLQLVREEVIELSLIDERGLHQRDVFGEVSEVVQQPVRWRLRGRVQEPVDMIIARIGPIRTTSAASIFRPRAGISTSNMSDRRKVIWAATPAMAAFRLASSCLSTSISTVNTCAAVRASAMVVNPPPVQVSRTTLPLNRSAIWAAKRASIPIVKVRSLAS